MVFIKKITESFDCVNCAPAISQEHDLYGQELDGHREGRRSEQNTHNSFVGRVLEQSVEDVFVEGEELEYHK